MGRECFALSYGSWHRKMVMGIKKIKEDQGKGKLRLEAAMVRVVNGLGHYVI